MDGLRNKCDGCGSEILQPFNIGYEILDEFVINNFKVTNNDYGKCVETVKCPVCTLIQPKYNLNQEIIAKFYKNLSDNSYLISSSQRGESNFNQVIKIIKKNKELENLNVLEVGAGTGNLLFRLKKHVKSVVGIEPNKEFCEFSKKNYGVNLINDNFNSNNFDEKFDVIIALDVIEHFTSIQSFMNSIDSVLKENGVVILSTPNIGSITAKVLNKKWWHIRPMHLFYFNDKCFKIFIEKSNFKLISKSYFKWNFPISYVLKNLQKLIFNKVYLSFSFLKFSININTFDSRIYAIKK